MRVLTVIFFLAFSNILFGQSNTFNETDDLLQSDRLFSYDDVKFKWPIEGRLQVALNEGINFLQEGQTAIALSNLNDFINQDSSFWAAYYYRGVCNKRLSKFKQAEKDLLVAISLNNGSYETILELAKVNHTKRNFKGAEKYYNKATILNPEKPIAYFLQGELELIQGNIRAAQKNYRTSLEKDATFSDARTKLAIIEILKSKNPEAGLPFLDKVLETDSLNRTALIYRGYINFKLNPKKSLLDYNKLVRINPASINIRLSRGLLLIELEDYESAFSDLRRVIQANNENENNFIGQQTKKDKKIDILNAGYYTISNIYGLDEKDAKKLKKGFCLLLVSKFQDCIQVLNEVDTVNKSALCFFLKGVAFEHMGKHPDALNNYTQALVFDNDIFDAHKKRAIYRHELTDWKGSSEDIKEMIRLNPESFVSYRLRGLFKINQKDYYGAIIDFTKYLKFDSLDAEIWKQRGIARSKVGDKKGSSDDLKKAIAIDPGINQELFEFVSQQYLEIQDTANAVDILKKYVSLAKGHPIPRLLLASIYADSKNWNQLKTQLDSVYLEIPTINVEGLIPSNFYYLQSKYSLGILDYEKAIYFANKSLQANSKNHASLYLRGQVYFKTGRQKKATKDFKVLSDLNYRDSRNIYKSLLSIGQQD